MSPRAPVEPRGATGGSRPLASHASDHACRYYVHHFWATTKPWLLQHTRCLQYFDFLNETNAAAATSVEVDGEGDSDASVCVPWLRKRRQRARSMAPLAHKECGGLRTCVFP